MQPAKVELYIPVDVRAQKLVLSQGTTFYIRYKNNKRNEEAKRVVPIMAGPEKNLFFALFEKDDVDFELVIDNTLPKDRDICYDLEIHKKNYRFVQDRGTVETLETVRTRGGQFHFVKQSGEIGQSLVSTAAKKRRMTISEAAEMVSQIKIEVGYSNVILPADEIIYVERVPHEIFRNKKNSKRNLKKVKVNLMDTIGDVRVKIQHAGGGSAEKQRLIFAGRSLEDDCSTLEDYGVQPGSTLQSVDPPLYARASAAIAAPGLKSLENTRERERGVIAFGEKSKQEFQNTYFFPDESIVIEPFVIEMRLDSPAS